MKRLGDILIDSGFLSQAELQEALEAQRADTKKKRLGEIIVEKGLLTERKKHIDTIYDGYVFQLYAQCLCLREMGYTVKSMRFYSSDNNKVYPVLLPEENAEMFEKFKSTNVAMQSFSPSNYEPQSPEKCHHCIYNDFCDRPLTSKAYCGGF